MSTAATAIESIPALDRATAMTLAAEENLRCTELVASFDVDAWTRPTDCVGWDVRALAGHILGSFEDFTSLRAMARMVLAARRTAGDGPMVDGMTANQVRDRAHLTTEELVTRLRAAGPAQVRFRTRVPALVRRAPLQETVGGRPETWRLGYLLETILTRDTWMHRVDLSRATGRPLALTIEHDGRLVADVVAEWARRHGRPCTLVLTGPVGRTFTQAGGGEVITVDAVELCRTLSGRATGAGLLTQEVPF